MKRKVIATMMATAMSASMLVGAAVPVAASAEEETVTVKWLMFGDKAEDHDLVMEDLNKKLKEKINVELDLEMIPQGEYNDKVKLAQTAGEDFDLVFTSNWMNSFNDNMTREAFLPLDELLDECGQELKEAVPDWLMAVGQVNGQQYAIPNQQIIARQLGVVIQKEYADKYGFDLTALNSVEDLYPLLDQVAANEPDKFPIDYRLFSSIELQYENLVGEYVFIDKNDPDATLIPCTEIYPDELRLDNELYQKGYIRKDVATVVDSNPDITAGRYVCVLNTYKPGGDAEMTQRTGGIDCIIVPMGEAYVKAVSGFETMTAININSKHPEEAMKLLSLVYTDPEIYNELLYGIEGVHYNKTDDTHIETIEGSKYSTYSAYGWKFGNQFNAYYLPGQADGLWEETDKLNNDAQVSVLRGFTFDSSNVQAELAQLAAVEAEFKNGQYTTDDIEQFIADRNAKLEQAGLGTLMEEVQRQVDEWKASK